jgi:hypothetical protein
MNSDELRAIRERIATKTADIADIKALSREVDILRSLVRAVEWEKWQDGKEYCPWCTWDKASGHAKTCERQVALGITEAQP